jgi:hypothetical protein
MGGDTAEADYCGCAGCGKGEGMKNLLDQITESSKAFANALRPAAEQAGRAMQELHNAFYTEAKNQWRAKRGRLPGSDRTARLRKKRQSKVMAWYIKGLFGDLEARRG